MYPLYNVAVHLVSIALRFISPFNPKIRLFVQGRRETFAYLMAHHKKDIPTIWVHAASLGEFEQGLPVIEKVRLTYPEYQVLVTFFSPSGYEVKKASPSADLICYLPMDTISSSRRFISLVKPEIAIFIKYEIWPNFLRELSHRNIPVILISAIFKKKQVYFRWYGHFMRKALDTISHFFVQDEASATWLKSIGISRFTVSGDTRFDRVNEIRSRDNTLDFMEGFKNGTPCVVAGSSWPEDEKFLVPYINTTVRPARFVIAPHNIKPDHIAALRQSIHKKTLLYTEWNEKGHEFPSVLIIDTIGLLTKIYSYADIAYVGGGFATGLHNTLEPAVFGIPVITGPNYKGFREAEDMVGNKGVFPVSDGGEFRETMDRLLEDPAFARQAGKANEAYINANKGASVQIMNYIRTLL